MDIKEKIKRDRKRQISMGITEGIWRFVDRGKHSCAHAELDGLRFDLRKGAPFQGKYILPGGKDCICLHTPIIPGLDDEPLPKKRSWIARIFGRR